MKFDTKRINYCGGMLQVEMPVKLLGEAGTLQQKVNGGKELSVEIKVKRQHRSLNANSYCWLLCSRIAEKLIAHTAEMVYREAIRNAGVRDYLAMTDRAYERFAKEWSKDRIGCFVERIRDAKNLNNCSTVAVYYGSSEYDTKEMARLIDWLEHSAEELDCDTLSEADKALLMDDWGRESA